MFPEPQNEINYISFKCFLCPLCSHRMEMSHSKAEARVSTESSPKSSGLERCLCVCQDRTLVCLRGCFDASPQLS